MYEPVVTKDISNRRLTIDKVFRAPLHKVWSAWTVDTKLERWWGPEHWPATSHSFDFREGGHWHYKMTGPDGTQYWGLLNYAKIRPMTQLQVNDYFSDAKAVKASPEPNSRWEVRFKKLSGNETRVVTRLNFSTEAALEKTLEMGFEAGYKSALSNLDRLLVGRGTPQTVVSKDGTQIVYEKIGSGPALILVSGAMVTRNYSGHVELAGLLASKFTVYNYDRRGRGDSTDTPPYSIDREIEDLDALIQVAGGSAAVFGLSSGAVLALHAAAAGSKIHQLALYEPPFVVEPGDRRPPADALHVVTKMIAQGRNAAAASYFMTEIFGMPAFVPLLMRLSPYWKPTVAVAPSLPHDLTVVGDYAIPERFASIQTPSLVLYGDKTQALLVHAAERLARVLPSAVLKTLPNQSHDVSPEVLVPMLEAFLKSGRGE